MVPGRKIIMNIQIDKDNTRFLLTNDVMSYGFTLMETGLPVNLYWGAPLFCPDDMPTPEQRQVYRHRSMADVTAFYRELSVFGGKFFDESALKFTFPDGIRASDFRFTGFEKGDDSLVLSFRDAMHPLVLKLRYKLYKEVLVRSCSFINEGNAGIGVENFASATWHLPGDVTDWRVTHLAGHWGKEAMPCHEKLTPGKFTIESRTGITGPYHIPFFAMDDGSANEFSGRVFFGSVLWSGNWKIVFERDCYERGNISGGINDFDSRFTLKPGETFDTPDFVAGFTPDGFGEMSRILHRWQDDSLLPSGVAHKELPMLTNTWGSLALNVNEKNVIETARTAARIGSELFVIDDGWQHALGDWYPDPVKFPNGLRPVIEEVAKLGMTFGLWIEPEAFEIKSNLYKEHPEWAMAYPGCEPDVRYRGDADRHSMMLNLANPEVADYLYTSIHKLVAETGLSYLKLDMNTFFSSPGGAERIWIDYAHNLDWIFQTLAKDFPSLLMENCASGAGRTSLQMTRSFGRINRSDNQDALDILKLHEGFTYMNMPRMAGGACHISDTMRHVNNRTTPLKFQAYCGMLGSLACGKPLGKCSDEEIAEIRSYVDLYKKLRPVIHNGDFYRLASAFEHPYAIYEYVAKDRSEAVVFVLGASIQFGDRVPFFLVPGLDPDAVYEIECHGTVIPDQAEYFAEFAKYTPMTGRGLAQVGLHAALVGDYDCRILHLKRK